MVLPSGMVPSTFRGTVCRIVQKGVDPLSSEGSRKAGGRYNAAGDEGVLYTSLATETAVSEVERGLRARGIDPDSFSPESYWAYDLVLSVEKVLDLTNDGVLGILGITRNSLTGSDTSLTRAIARDARAAGYEAILVPSAAVDGAVNLVVFLPMLSHPIQVESSSPVTFTG